MKNLIRKLRIYFLMRSLSRDIKRVERKVNKNGHL